MKSILAALLLLLGLTGVASAQGMTANPNPCWPGVGNPTCAVTITWWKGQTTFDNYAITMMEQRQTDGYVNAPYPGVVVACGPNIGTGQSTVNLDRSAHYTYELRAGNNPCWRINSDPFTFAPPLDRVEVYVQPLN